MATTCLRRLAGSHETAQPARDEVVIVSHKQSKAEMCFTVKSSNSSPQKDINKAKLHLTQAY